MIYIWNDPHRYPNKWIGEHDQEKSPFYIDFIRGVPAQGLRPFIVKFEVPYSRLSDFDVLPIDCNLPLVKDRVLQLIQKFDPEAVHPLDVNVTFADGLVGGFHLLNVTRRVPSIDWGRSIIRKRVSEVDGAETIGSITHLVCHPDALSKHGYDLARDSEFLGHIIVSQRLRDAFVQANIKGVDLREPERLFG